MSWLPNKRQVKRHRPKLAKRNGRRNPELKRHRPKLAKRNGRRKPELKTHVKVAKTRPSQSPFHGLSQNCSEKAVLAAAAKLDPPLEKFLFAHIHEVYAAHSPADVQIDLLAFLTIVHGDKNVFKYCGNSASNFLSGIGDLDSSQIYFLRTGTMGGPGHYQLFFFEPGKKVWWNYSSEKNNFAVTNKKGQMTLAGKRLLRPYGKWGMNKGEYAYVFTAVTADMLLPAVQYIIDVRTVGEEQALRNIF